MFSLFLSSLFEFLILMKKKKKRKEKLFINLWNIFHNNMKHAVAVNNNKFIKRKRFHMNPEKSENEGKRLIMWKSSSRNLFILLLSHQSVGVCGLMNSLGKEGINWFVVMFYKLHSFPDTRTFYTKNSTNIKKH